MITSYLLAIFFSFSVIFLIYKLKVIDVSKNIINRAGDSLITITNVNKSDDLKEKELKSNTLSLIKLLFKLLFLLTLALFIPTSIIWFLDLLGLVALEKVFHILLDPFYLLFLIIILIIFSSIFHRKEKQNSFSEIDKLIHKIAFNTYHSSNKTEKKETNKYKKALAEIKIDRPVFITSLPRAGTTILLEILSHLDIFCTHRYKDMPFLLTPIYWKNFSKFLRKKMPKQERKHQDGIMIDNDSPEALEEVIWQLFLSFQIKNNYIATVSKINISYFSDFFYTHLKKIIYVRSPKKPSDKRYISKNNLNISRLPIIKQMFPNSKIIIPFRSPLHHAYSLMKQHKNFSKIHNEDEFYKLYMKKIGHYDFGFNFKPINFNNWLNNKINTNYFDITFWLEYWIETYGYLINLKLKNCYFFDYDYFSKKPQESLQRLEKVLEIKTIDLNLSYIHESKKYNVDYKKIDDDLLNQANQLHKNLIKRSINHETTT